MVALLEVVVVADVADDHDSRLDFGDDGMSKVYRGK